MKQNRKTVAVILSAGSGSRMGGDVAKQRMLLRGQSILYQTVHIFDRIDEIDQLILVVREEDASFAEGIAKDCEKAVTVILGGEDRQTSAYLGALAADGADFVAIHDGARCLVTPDIIRETVKAAWHFGAACAVGAVSDTVKRVGEDGTILETVPRDSLRFAQTPQVFRRDLYLSAVAYAKEHGIRVTDDASLLEATGTPVLAVLNTEINQKITYPEDVTLAEYVMKTREEHL